MLIWSDEYKRFLMRLNNVRVEDQFDDDQHCELVIKACENKDVGISLDAEKGILLVDVNSG